jgi:hypothetical protein
MKTVSRSHKPGFQGRSLNPRLSFVAHRPRYGISRGCPATLDERRAALSRIRVSVVTIGDEDTTAKVQNYSAEDIERLRSIIDSLYLSDDTDLRQMSRYERRALGEQMLQTYMSAGISHHELQALLTKKTVEEPEGRKAAARSAMLQY